MPTTPQTTSTRRRFLHQSAVAASCAAMPTSLRAQDSDSSGWIDAHVHVWTKDTEKYPLSPRFDKADMRPAEFTDSELLRQCRPHGVGRIVLIQMSFYEYDHSYMFDVMKAHPGVFSGVALVDHKKPDLVTKMRALADAGMRGIRLHSRGDAGTWAYDSGMSTLWSTAIDLGLAVCPLVNPEDIPVVVSLCKKFPRATVVVDHFARVGLRGDIDDGALDQLCRLSRFPNTHVKTSAFYALGAKTPPYDDLIPMIRRVYESFGARRLMWATDCPFQVQGVHSYEASIALIRDRVDFLSDADKRWLLRGTAEKVFF